MLQSTIQSGLTSGKDVIDFWDSEKIFLSGDDYFDDLLKDIEAATKEITVEIYIFHDDVVGTKVAESLIRARARGVIIQIIVDGVGSYHFHQHLYEKFRRERITVKLYNPLPFIHPFFGKLKFSQKLHILTQRLLKLNKRNHRKMITIDGSILYMGSFNITADHTKHSSSKAWKDMGVRVTGANVQLAILNFKRLWKLKDYYRYRKALKKQKISSARHSPLRLSNSVFSRNHFYRDFLRRIDNAKEKIWLTTPYFIPKRKLIKKIGNAAKRGVDVRLLISSKSDVALFRTLQYFYYPYLISCGAKVFQYSDTILHAKNYIIDEWISIGSTNLNHRSLMHDLEADVIIQRPENCRLVEEEFRSSIKNENELSLAHLTELTFWDRALSRMYFIFRYWF